MNNYTQALRRPLAFLTALAFAAVAAVPVFAATAPTSDVAVVDDAGILSTQTENYITNVSVALQDTCGAQIGVYTTEYVGNSTMEGFAYNIFTQWGLGSSTADNGVLLLLSPGDDDYYLMRGEGLEKDLSISVVGTILDNELEPSWLNADYDGGTQKTVRALAERLCKIYGVTMDVDAVGSGEAAYGSTQPAAEEDDLGFGALVLIVLALILVFWFIGFLLNTRRRGPGRMPPPPGGPMGGVPYRGRDSRMDSFTAGFMGGMLGSSIGGSSRRRRTPPWPDHHGGFSGFDAPPRGPFGGAGGVGRSSGGHHSGGMGGGHRSGGGSFHAGGGSTRGGGVGRRH